MTGHYAFHAEQAALACGVAAAQSRVAGLL